MTVMNNCNETKPKSLYKIIRRYLNFNREDSQNLLKGVFKMDQTPKQVVGNVLKCRQSTSTRFATPRLFVLLNVTASLLINLTCTRQAAEASSISTTNTATATTTTNDNHNHSHKSSQTSDSNRSISSDNNSRSRYRSQQDNNKQQNNDKSGKLASLVEQQQVVINSQQQETNTHQQEEGFKVANSAVETNALIYLQKYGYMQAHSNLEANNLISEDSFSNAISSFQKFAGLPETGSVDSETLKMMQMPRCGNVDKPTILDAHNLKSLVQLNNSNNNRQINSGIKFSSSRGSIFNSNFQLKRRRRRRRRKKRYALQGSKWRRQELTYRISQYPTRFVGKRYEVDSQIEKAFGIWSQVAPIDFIVKKDGRVHIDIRFANGDHGDGDAFDGPGNTLAHAYFPQYGGDAHFDDQEYWTIDSYAGTNIFQVAAHELGHSLGLGHSNVREALMAPFYQKYKPNFKLHIDDVLAIQALYGEKPFLAEQVPHQQTTLLNMSPSIQPLLTTSTTSTTTTSSTTTTTTTTTTTAAPPTSSTTIKTTRYIPAGGKSKPTFFGAKPYPPSDSPRETNDEETNGIPDLSTTLNGNAIGGNGNGNESEDKTTQPASYPSDLCTDSTIDAITRTEDGSSYVFKGDFYWLLTSDGLAKGYPRKISLDWDNLPGSLDAALTWADGKTFFFRGNKYWRYRNKRRDLGYPKLISSGFAGIPDDIDAAFVWSGNGRTYIFKGAEYWRFDSKANPPVSNEYPRSIKIWNGVPAHLNAAFKWENNVTYFFKGSQYYRFNDKEFKVESRGRPAFPRLSAEWWFGCVSSNLAQRAFSSSLLRENVNSTNDNQDIDWSFFAGLDGEQNTKIFATHISDHKPPPIGTIVKNIDETSSPSSSVVNQNNMIGKRIGLYKPNSTTTTTSSSSSAISVNKTISGLEVLLAILISTTLISFAKLRSSKCFSAGNYACLINVQNELHFSEIIPVNEQASFRLQVAAI